MSRRSVSGFADIDERYPVRLKFTVPPDGLGTLLSEIDACDLPLNPHPHGTRVHWVDTPIGAGGATDIRAELSDGAARVSVVLVRRSAHAFGVC